jgi:hypothetical protein
MTFPAGAPGSVTGASSMRAPPSAISRFASLPDFARPGADNELGGGNAVAGLGSG